MPAGAKAHAEAAIRKAAARAKAHVEADIRKAAYKAMEAVAIGGRRRWHARAKPTQWAARIQRLRRWKENSALVAAEDISVVRRAASRKRKRTEENGAQLALEDQGAVRSPAERLRAAAARLRAACERRSLRRAMQSLRDLTPEGDVEFLD